METPGGCLTRPSLPQPLLCLLEYPSIVQVSPLLLPAGPSGGCRQEGTSVRCSLANWRRAGSQPGLPWKPPCSFLCPSLEPLSHPLAPGPCRSVGSYITIHRVLGICLWYDQFPGKHLCWRFLALKLTPAREAGRGLCSHRPEIQVLQMDLKC